MRIRTYTIPVMPRWPVSGGAIWQGIARANVLLASVNRPPMDETKRDIIKGETLFLRGYYHFLLAINFGDVPVILNPVPSVDSVHIARTPLKNVYTQILKDMTEAESLLQTQTVTSLGLWRPHKQNGRTGHTGSGVFNNGGISPCTILLNTRMPRNGLKKCAPGEHALNPDYKQIFINYAQDKYDVKESIWEIEFAGNGAACLMNQAASDNNIGVKVANLETGYSYGSVNVTNKLYEMYEAADLRL